jgi:hypothetical protein
MVRRIFGNKREQAGFDNGTQINEGGIDMVCGVREYRSAFRDLVANPDEK